MDKKMTPAEEVIMQCLWESGEDLTVYELKERLKAYYGKDYADNAVATFMKNLLKRGLVSRYKKHHSYQWHVEIDMEAYRNWITSASSGSMVPGAICLPRLWKFPM